MCFCLCTTELLKLCVPPPTKIKFLISHDKPEMKFISFKCQLSVLAVKVSLLFFPFFYYFFNKLLFLRQPHFVYTIYLYIYIYKYRQHSLNTFPFFLLPIFINNQMECLHSKIDKLNYIWTLMGSPLDSRTVSHKLQV